MAGETLVQSHSTLLLIPGELRNEIYRLCFEQPTKAAVNEDGDPVAEPSSLSQVSSQVRKEFCSLWRFQHRNLRHTEILYARVLDLDFSQLFAFLGHAHKEQQLCARLERIEMHLVFGAAAQEALAPEVLFDWEDDFIELVKKTMKLNWGQKFRSGGSNVGLVKMSELMHMAVICNRKVVKPARPSRTEREEDCDTRVLLHNLRKVESKVRSMTRMLAGLNVAADCERC